MNNFYDKLATAKTNVENEIAERKRELEQLEADLSDQKINPYGITNIDFSKRLEMIEDITKMEGVVMGLQLAQDSFVEHEAETEQQ
jgi:hypothetical protein